ncbi:uncharacterized protein LOC136746568 isoform X2 [Amia ocellicauda]
MIPASTQQMQTHKDDSRCSEPLKTHIQNSRELLVESMYNIAPLLDHMIATHLLTEDNYYDVIAENTPKNKVRKLLEVVQHQMDEDKALHFLDCLKKCRKDYPRLRDWLNTDPSISRGPTEQRLRAQFSELCSRLGYLVLPLSLQLFSGEVLSQFEVDQVQACPTPFLQSQKLLSLCLARGEAACQRFYQALHSQDSFLATAIDECTNSAAALEAFQPFSDASVVTRCSVAVEETNPLGDQILNLTLKTEYGEEIELPTEEKDVLRQVIEQLGVAPDSRMTLNVCELGTVLGLPRQVVRECLLELESIEDLPQLAALVHCFLEKTRDPARLLSKLAACHTKSLMLSERGTLVLELLQEAAALLGSGQKEEIQKCWNIFSFLLWDCLAKVEEDPTAAPWPGHLGAVQQLRESGRVDPALAQELQECWTDGMAESLLQSLRVLAQLLKDMHPHLDAAKFTLQLQGEVYHCRPRFLNRVTRFVGLSTRTIYRVLPRNGPQCLKMDPDSLLDRAAVAAQYEAICLQMARLLARVAPQGHSSALTQAAGLSEALQEIQSTLSQPKFGSDAFDTGVKHCILSVAQFDPVTAGVHSLVNLHSHTLQLLGEYLRSSDRHSFQFVPEAVRMVSSRAELRGVRSERGPVAMDGGVEEVFRFSMSEPASFLLWLSCHGYRDQEYFQSSQPRSFHISGLSDSALDELESQGAVVLAVDRGHVWLREGSQDGLGSRLQAFAERHNAVLEEGSCCVLITTTGEECEVKVTFKHGKISATTENCSVL